VATINLALGASFAGSDNFAHVGGLLGGVALGALLTPRYEIIRDLNGVPQARRRDSFF